MVLRLLAGPGLGGTLGSLLGYWGKCASGTCPLTANPWRGALFGMLFGLVFALSFGPDRGAAETTAAEKVTEITGEESFRTRVEEADGLVLVKFYADWCGWCKKLAPIVEKLAGEYEDKMSFVKVDTDAQKKLAGRFGVEGLPTMIIFKDGKQIEKIVGYRDEQALRKTLDKHLGKAR